MNEFAIRAQKAVDLAPGNVDVDFIYSFDIVKMAGQFLHLNGELIHCIGTYWVVRNMVTPSS